MCRHLSIVMALVTTAAFHLSVSAAESVNVFPQGRIESVDGTAAEGWTLQPGAEVITEGDNHYLQFSNTDLTQSAWALGALPLAPEWVALRVSVRLKATNLKRGPEAWHCAHCILNFRTADGKDAGYGPSPKLTTDSDWVTQTLIIDIPKGAAALHLQPGLWASTGVMCLDDIVMTPVEKQGLFPGPVVRLDRDSGFTEGRFESYAEGNDMPQGWGEWPQVAEVVTEGGNHWVRVSNSNPKAMPALRTNLRLPADCTSLRLTARLKATGLNCGPEPWQNARVVVSPCNATGEPLGSLPGPALTVDSDWQALTTDLSLPPDTRYLVLWVGLWQATGVLDIDDVQVQVTE